MKAVGLGMIFLTLETYAFYLLNVSLAYTISQSVNSFIGYVLLPYVLVVLGTVIYLIGHAVVSEPAEELKQE